MAVHNGALFLRQQIDSILPQLNGDDELIFSDDASADNSLEIINFYSDPKIHFVASKEIWQPHKKILNTH